MTAKSLVMQEFSPDPHPNPFGRIFMGSGKVHVVNNLATCPRSM
jgi:hypothetical protein